MPPPPISNPSQTPSSSGSSYFPPNQSSYHDMRKERDRREREAAEYKRRSRQNPGKDYVCT